MENIQQNPSERESMKFFKIKMRGPLGYHIPPYVCEAGSSAEAMQKARMEKTQDLNEGYVFEEPEEISSERFEKIQKAAKGDDQIYI